MLRNSFLFIPGIGEKTEARLWQSNVITWDDLQSRIGTVGISKSKQRVIQEYLEKANRALLDGRAAFFGMHLPVKEYWRAYSDFESKTVFLDIETTGLSLHYDKITLIGCYDGTRTRVFVKGNGLEDIIDYLRDYEVIVTFNGKLFDIPFVRKEFPKLRIPPIHIDLRYLLRSLGITGPLKRIEQMFGVKRPEEIQGIDGRGAAVLWSRFVRGDDTALQRLLLYNTYDTINLKALMDFCYQMRVERTGLKLSGGHWAEEPVPIKAPRYLVPSVTTRVFHSEKVDIMMDSRVIGIDRGKIDRVDIEIGSLIRLIQANGHTPVAVGIDLSGSETRETGICVLRDRDAYLAVAKRDGDIVSMALAARPAIISIDSPLSLPRGRCCAEDSCGCRKYGITRECERILKKKGINVYPCLIRSMQKLTVRGIMLAGLFSRQGYNVIESYPGAAQDILRFPRKRVDLEELKTDLVNMGIRVHSDKEVVTHDQIDALTAALVGYFYLAGSYEAIGNPDEGYLIIPAVGSDNDLQQSKGGVACLS